MLLPALHFLSWQCPPQAPVAWFAGASPFTGAEEGRACGGDGAGSTVTVNDGYATSQKLQLEHLQKTQCLGCEHQLWHNAMLTSFACKNVSTEQDHAQCGETLALGNGQWAKPMHGAVNACAGKWDAYLL